jgi:diguanylate cyclase (GGDEF)-like protein
MDIFARFGGDEFVLLLPNSNYEQARVIIERIRLILTRQTIELKEGNILLSFSSGIASFDDKNDTLDKLLHCADQALYQAKEMVKNRGSDQD